MSALPPITDVGGASKQVSIDCRFMSTRTRLRTHTAHSFRRIAASLSLTDKEAAMTHLLWLSDDAWAAIEPHLPRGKPGKPRVDDRRVISGILRIFEKMAAAGPVPEELCIDTSHVKAHRSAAGSKRGSSRKRLGARAAEEQAKSMLWPMIVADRSPSP